MSVLLVLGVKVPCLMPIRVKPRPCKFFGNTGEQAFQTVDDCLAVPSIWLKILKADIPVLPKKNTWPRLVLLFMFYYYQKPDLIPSGFLLGPGKINVTAFDYDTITVVAS